MNQRQHGKPGLLLPKFHRSHKYFPLSSSKQAPRKGNSSPQLLKKLSRSNARVRRRKERLNIALVVLGLSTPAPLTVIGVHLANIAAANAATVAFPGIGWAFGGITAALIVTAYVLYRQTVIERNKRDAWDFR